MFIFEISLEIKNTQNKEEIINNLWTFSASLLHNGQILQSIDIISENKNKIFIIVLCPEMLSLNNKFSNKYVISSLNELEKSADTNIEIKFIGKDAEISSDKDIECCNKTNYYILFNHYFKKQSPVSCGNCFKPIPIYKICKEKNLGILAWQENYKACDWLQLGSTVGKKFGLNEMSNFDTKLTKEGLEVCKNIEEIKKSKITKKVFNSFS
ncbi:MAG: DUF2310 family Zn-ribbon-containing protein, partial [Candidatus Sericytochromatia bacterium]